MSKVQTYRHTLQNNITVKFKKQHKWINDILWAFTYTFTDLFEKFLVACQKQMHVIECWTVILCIRIIDIGLDLLRLCEIILEIASDIRITWSYVSLDPQFGSG